MPEKWLKNKAGLKEVSEIIINSLNEGIWVEDEEGFCVYANPKEAEMLGYTQEELIGKHWSEIVHPSGYERMKRESEKRSRGIASSYETFLLTKNKEKLPVIISATPLFKEGKYIGVIGVTIDIRKQKELEKKLSALYELSKELALSRDVKKIAEITVKAMKKILRFDTSFFLLLDKNYLNIVSYSGFKENVVGKSFFLNAEKGIIPWVAREGRSYLTNNTDRDDLFVNIIGDFDIKSEICVPIKIKNKVIGVLNAESRKYNAFDEKDLELLEILASQVAIAIENARLMEEMKRSSEFQRLFISILSHDLKNPLTVIKGYTDLIAIDADERTKKYISKIQNNIKKMENLIENAKVYSTLKEKQYKKEFKKKNMRDIIKSALTELEIKAKEKNINMLSKVKGVYHIKANSVIDEVFINLIDNAIKYSPENSRIEIDIEDTEDKWRIGVKDWGEGVADELKEAIFERFERGEVNTKGSGLGLAIVKQIVDLHGGRVWVEDNPEGGSIFFVELPKIK